MPTSSTRAPWPGIYGLCRATYPPHTPEVSSLTRLRRASNILGWMSRRRFQTPALTTASYINLLIALRWTFHELARTLELPELPHLIRREDIPRLPYRLPRPLTAERDQLLQREFLRPNDLDANVFLLIRHSDMRIGECVDLASDGLRATGLDQWAIPLPLSKLKTERLAGPGGSIYLPYLAERAPCLPSRTCSIASRSYSVACADGDRAI